MKKFAFPPNLKQELKELEKIKGEVRGMGLKGDAYFIYTLKGEKGLAEMAEAMNYLGYPFDYRQLKAGQFYPLYLAEIGLVVMKHLFHLSEKDFKFSGRLQAKLPIILRLLLPYLGSLANVVRKASEMWRKNFTVGELKIDLREKEKKIIIQLWDFPAPSPHYQILEGYFAGLWEIISGEKVASQRRETGQKQGLSCEFVLSW